MIYQSSNTNPHLLRVQWMQSERSCLIWIQFQVLFKWSNINTENLVMSQLLNVHLKDSNNNIPEITTLQDDLLVKKATIVWDRNLKFNSAEGISLVMFKFKSKINKKVTMKMNRMKNKIIQNTNLILHLLCRAMKLNKINYHTKKVVIKLWDLLKHSTNNRIKYTVWHPYSHLRLNIMKQF